MELYEKGSKRGNVVESQGGSDEKSFGIANNAHMFNILVNGLYKDKIGAVLQEIGCNAVDAHIEGKIADTPIEVKLPSSLDPLMYIRDYGPGLSDEKVMGMYTTMGESTKQQSNEQTGAFGLGSKSPFAYTCENDEDSNGFTVTTIHKGIKRIYMCFMRESGEPGIKRMYEGENTDENWKSGLEVSFPVRPRDVNEFHRVAVNKFRWFRVQPKVLGLNTAWPKDADEFSVVKPEYRLYKYQGSHTSLVVMGGVAYPIEVSSLRKFGFSDLEISILEAGVVLHVPLGSVFMTPSRESLQYNDRTAKGLKDALQIVAKDIADGVKARVIDTEYDSYWEKLKDCYEYVQTLGRYISENLAEYLIFAGVPSTEAKAIVKEISQKAIMFQNWIGFGAVSPGLEDEVAAMTEKELKLVEKSYAKASANGSLTMPVFTPSTNPNDAASDALKKEQTMASFMRNRAIVALSNECRVHMFAFSEQREGTISKREIIRGKFPSNSSTEQAAVLSLDSEYVFVIADSTSVDDRIRNMVKESNNRKFRAILVTPLAKKADNSQEIAQKYVERMQKEQGFDGIKVIMSSSIDISDIKKERNNARAQKRVAAPGVLYAGEHVRYFDVVKGHMVEGSLADFTQASDFWMVNCESNYTSKSREYNIVAMFNQPAFEKSHSNMVNLKLYYRDRHVWSAYTALISLITGHAITKIMLLPSETKVKRWKLVEAGFDFLDAKFNEVLADNPNIIADKYTETAVKTWSANPSSWNFRKETGVLGSLVAILHGFNEGSARFIELWTQIFSKFGAHPMVLKAIELVSMYDEFVTRKSQSSNLDVNDFNSVINYLRSNCNMTFIESKSDVIDNPYLANISIEMLPESKFMDWNRFVDKDEFMMEALDFLMTDLPALRAGSVSDTSAQTKVTPMSPQVILKKVA